MPTEKTYRRHKPQPTPIKKPTEEMFRKENEYYKPELELYETPIEIGFSASDPEADNDFEYGDGGDAW